MPTIAELLERIKAGGGGTYTNLDPGFDRRMGTGTNLDPGFGISMGTGRNLDPGIERRVTNDPAALGSFLNQGGGGLYDNKAIVPIPTTWPQLPEGQLPWKAEPNLHKGRSGGDIRDFMKPLSTERDKKSWWKTSNLQNWRQRNR
jgi:hypothetical protein